MNGAARLYVAGLDYSETEETIMELFSPFGPVKKIFMPQNKESTTMSCAGFCFIEFLLDSDARRALDDLNGKTFNGRTLKVDFARPKRPLSSDWQDRRTLAGGD